MIIHNVEQNTPEWLQLKAGKFSASRAKDLFMKSSTKGYQGLIGLIAAERISGQYMGSTFKSSWMARGNELEPAALEDYELNNFVKLRRVGFIEMDEKGLLSWVGCSPDSLVDSNGNIQVKCIAPHNHLELMQNPEIDKDYYIQCQFEMWVCNTEFNILYYYCPGLKSIEFKIDRDNEMIENIKTAVNTAQQEVLAKIHMHKNYK